jgi:hypothetical protein
MKPDSKLKERHTQKTRPENRPDVDAEKPNSGFEEAAFEDPVQKNDKKPDPNWQDGKYGQEKREGNSADKVYDGE